MIIYNEDARDILRDMEDNSIDLVLTDPPYDLSEEDKMWFHNQFMRISKNGAIVFSPPENQWVHPVDQYGFWIKPISTKNTSRRYSRFVEMIFFYSTTIWNSDRHWSQYSNVFTDLVEGATKHPYEKPVSLIKRLLLNHSNVGDTILDPFAGSGTIGLVAKDNDRDYILIEKEKEYCELMRERLFFQ